MVQTGSALRLPFKRAFELILWQFWLCEWKGPYSWIPAWSFKSLSIFPLATVDKVDKQRILVPGDAAKWDWTPFQRRGDHVCHGDLFDLHLGDHQCHESASKSQQPLEQHMVKRHLLTFADLLLEVGFSGLSRNSQVEVVQVIIPKQSPVTRWGAIQSPGIS